MTVKDMAEAAKVNAATVHRWKKAGILASELAKRGVGISPGTEDRVFDEEKKAECKLAKKLREKKEEAEDKVPPKIRKLAEKINKKFGAGTFSCGSFGFSPIKKIPTKVIPLDEILGGGLASGKIAEIYGEMATGKTTLCIHIAKGFQEEGFRVMYIDAEYSFDRVYAEAIGLDMDKLDFVQPESLEDGLEVMREACRESTHELIIFDSVAAARLRPETEGDVGDANMGRKGFIMSQAVRMLVPDAAQSFTTLLFVNQVRESLKNWGSATYRPAGKALDFASVQMVELKSPASKDAVRKEVIMKCTKNKTYPPLGERKMTLEYGKGFVS